MIEHRGITLVELDHQSSEARQPHGIITVDCSNPKEFDDGISVTPLDSAKESYRVEVFAVDTSSLYGDGAVIKQVLDRTESVYQGVDHDLPNAYIPMLSETLVKDHDFRQGNTRDALVVSFDIGTALPPSNVDVTFGRVEVEKNFTYKAFGNKCRYSHQFDKYGRAAALILKHLSITDSSEEQEAYRELIHVPTTEAWRRGSNINAAYMIAANHLVGRLMAEEDYLAIYRRHDVDNPQFNELFSPDLATYSLQPGPHEGLGLDVYTRVTSPLRRAEDFVMHGLLRARAAGRELTSRDTKIATIAVRRLNQRIAAQAFQDKPRLDTQSVWGRHRRRDVLAG